MLRYATLALGVLALPALASASFSLSTSTPYVQNFDTLPSTGTSTTWTDNTTLAHWASNRATINVNTGSGTTGGLYSFGAASSSDRALGSLGSGSANPVTYAVRLTLANPLPVNPSISVSYVGEQWRTGGKSTTEDLVFEYIISSSSSAPTSGWTSVSALTFTSPVTGGSARALDGNASVNRVARSALLDNLMLAAGDTIWMRWRDVDDSNADHGLAIDDLTVAVPEPSALGVLALGGLLTLRRRR